MQLGSLQIARSRVRLVPRAARIGTFGLSIGESETQTGSVRKRCVDFGWVSSHLHVQSDRGQTQVVVTAISSLGRI